MDANWATHVRLPGVYKEGCGGLQAACAGEIAGKMMKSGWDGGKAAVCREIWGFRLYPGFLTREAQVAMAAALREVVAAAPLVQPVTPGGRVMSVRMTAAGRLGWVTDRKGYRYEGRRGAAGMARSRPGAAWVGGVVATERADQSDVKGGGGRVKEPSRGGHEFPAKTHR